MLSKIIKESFRKKKVTFRRLTEEEMADVRDDQEETGAQDKLIDFFKNTPNPTDDQVHDLADDMGIEPHDLEEKIYALLTSLLNKDKKADKEAPPDAFVDGSSYVGNDEDEPTDEFDFGYGDMSMGESEEKLTTFTVHVPANVYDGKYYDYRTVGVHVWAKNKDDAISVINKNKEAVLKKIDSKRTHSKRRFVASPVEKNVFFRDHYYVKQSGMSGKNMAMNISGNMVDVDTL